MTALIEAIGLTKTFGSVRAVDDVTFTAHPGRVTGFLGPKGAGKSTTLRMLLGLTAPDAGTALVGGRRYRDLADPTGTIGAVLDIAGAHPAMTARGHLRVCCELGGHPAGRIAAVAEQAGVTAFLDRRIRGFSTGMRQRLALATALLGDPPALVLDEPSNGLDPAGIAWLRAFLRAFADSGRTVLLSSHVLTEVQQAVDDVVLIDGGRVVWTGALTEFTTQGESLEDAFLHATDTTAHSFPGIQEALR